LLRLHLLEHTIFICGQNTVKTTSCHL
jgi:hypothetical protein